MQWLPVLWVDLLPRSPWTIPSSSATFLHLMLEETALSGPSHGSTEKGKIQVEYTCFYTRQLQIEWVTLCNYPKDALYCTWLRRNFEPPMSEQAIPLKHSKLTGMTIWHNPAATVLHPEPTPCSSASTTHPNQVCIIKSVRGSCDSSASFS